MYKVKHYKQLKNNIVQCNLCPHFCTLQHDERGKCLVRINQKGKLYSLVYSKPCSVAIDPIEKKPLYHFMPGSKVFSIGTAGCNLKCKFCQNWTISQSRPEELKANDLTPKQVVAEAIKNGCKGIAYTYSEPTIFYEYVLDTAKLANKNGLKNIVVTNGFINPEPIKELYPFIDAANIDLKGFTEQFYAEVAGARLEPVLDAIKLIQKQGTFIEITNLIIPTMNDNFNTIKKMCNWISSNLGKDTPLHFSRFFPDYRLQDILPTPLNTMNKAYDLAKNSGLNFVYLGNISASNNTYCPKCKTLLVKRENYRTKLNFQKNCKCGYEVPGVWIEN